MISKYAILFSPLVRDNSGGRWKIDFFFNYSRRSIPLGYARSHGFSGFPQTARPTYTPRMCFAFINVRIYILYIYYVIYIYCRVCLFIATLHDVTTVICIIFFAIYVRDNIDLAIVYRHMIL